MPSPKCRNNSYRAKVTITVLLLLVSLSATGAVDAQEQAASNLTPPASSQPTTFDVISVKPSDPKNTSITIRLDPNNFTMTGASIEFLIEYAYDLQSFQLEGLDKLSAIRRRRQNREHFGTGSTPGPERQTKTCASTAAIPLG